MRVATPGQVIFAATLIALALVGALRGDFAPVWEPVPKDIPAREFLVYLCAVISLTCGLGLLWRRTAASAACLLLIWLLLWLLLFRLPVVLRAPAVEVSWESCAETVVICSGAWVLFAWFGAGWDLGLLRFATGEAGVRIAQVLYGAALIPFGLAHFVYVKETATLVPAWLPAHSGWAYFTGAAYLAAGAAVLTGVCSYLAAVLSAWQMGMFTLLVWIPIVLQGSASTPQWSETVLSWALTAAAWVVAESCRRTPQQTTGTF
jgi:uncharacterized membrane protein